MENKELIYHFTSLEGLIKILITDSIRLSNINDVNDIEESNGLFINGASEKTIAINNIDKEVSKIVEVRGIEQATKVVDVIKECNKAYDEIKGNKLKYDKFKKNIFVTCFSKGANQRFMNIMMSHYGDKHKGVCIVFNKENLDELFKEYKTNYGLSGYAEDVEYETLFENSIKEKDFLEACECESEKEKMEMFIKNYFFNKNNEWSYEEEYRYVIWDKGFKSKEYSYAIKEYNNYYLYGISKCIEKIKIGEKQTSDSNLLIGSIMEGIGSKYVFEHFRSGVSYIEGISLEVEDYWLKNYGKNLKQF